MARVVPNAMRERLEFFNSHAPTWVANAASIGLTPAQAAAVQDLTDEAKAALAAQISAMEAAKSATVRLQSAMEALTSAGTAAVATIKAYADSSNEPGPVYVTANIAPPKRRGTPTYPFRRSAKSRSSWDKAECA
jgi:hypothetical protein